MLGALRDSRPLFSVLFARRQLRIGRRRRWVARVGFSFPLLFLSPLFSEVSLALCKRIVWFYQLATLSIGVKDHKQGQCTFSLSATEPHGNTPSQHISIWGQVELALSAVRCLGWLGFSITCHASSLRAKDTEALAGLVDGRRE